MELCPVCLRKLQSNIKFDILERYERIYAYLEEKEDKRMDKLMHFMGEVITNIKQNIKKWSASASLSMPFHSEIYIYIDYISIKIEDQWAFLPNFLLSFPRTSLTVTNSELANSWEVGSSLGALCLKYFSLSPNSTLLDYLFSSMFLR